MIGSWWWFWFAFMFLFLVTPIGYGWGYRGWGAPYPRYFQRRRGDQGGAVVRSTATNAESWGWAGDFVWLILFVGAVWACSALFWGWGAW